MIIMQGDAYWIPIDIEQDGIVPQMEVFSEVEVTVGRWARKTASDGSVVCLEGQWYFHLSQIDTLKLEPGMHMVELRVKYNNEPEADVITVEAGMIEVRTANQGRKI